MPVFPVGWASSPSIIVKQHLQNSAVSRDKPPDVAQETLSRQIEELLARCEAENHAKFFDLVQLLVRHNAGPNLTSCRFWQLAESGTRDRIFRAARDFVMFEDPADYETSNGYSADPNACFVCTEYSV
jgi:hypothetical protein